MVNLLTCLVADARESTHKATTVCQEKRGCNKRKGDSFRQKYGVIAHCTVQTDSTQWLNKLQLY